MPDPRAQLATALGGRYEIRREIGVGGSAWVYLARDLRHERDVAIKLLRPALAEALRYYGQFVDQWRNADPRLQPAVADVRQRMAELQRQGG